VSKKESKYSLETKLSFTPNHPAMLQALRVVLDLPRKPLSFKENDDDQLALSAEKSDVCTLTARTNREGGQEE
jgi:hypothetical protein